MPRFTVQFKDGPQREVDAADRERAWDAYKAATGLRRGPYDPDPVIAEAVEAPAPAAAETGGKRKKKPQAQLERGGEGFRGTDLGPDHQP